MECIQYNRGMVKKCWYLTNTIFNNISVISWMSVLLSEETRVPEKSTNLQNVTDKYQSTSHYNQDSNFNSGDSQIE